jgi:hypothetical protein
MDLEYSMQRKMSGSEWDCVTAAPWGYKHRICNQRLTLWYLNEEGCAAYMCSALESETESELLYDWQFTVNQFLATSPL